VTLSIEPAPEVRQRTCEDCGRSFSTVHGFLYEEGDAYAVYHALLQRDHPMTVADLALSIGSWDEDATAASRKRIGIRVWPEADELKLHIASPDESSWGDSETFGKMVDRSDILGTPLEQEAVRSAEFVIGHDSRVRDHLR
jgi:hypothetical protein